MIFQSKTGSFVRLQTGDKRAQGHIEILLIINHNVSFAFALKIAASFYKALARHS